MMWKTKGMNQDLSVSAFNPEFAFENKNLRLATNDGNTTLSWVNEKGTKEVTPSIPYKGDAQTYIKGTPIGTAVFNDKFVVFTHFVQDDNKIDYIIRFTGDSSSLNATILYSGNLNFDTEHPLETLVSYENDMVQKVYWTDGVNQPRVINVSESMDDKIGDYTDTSFDFVPTLELNETIKVKKILGGGGSFAPGVIQYAFTYYNKYGQESNIFYTTPLMYVSYKDRGASPEDTSVDNTFKISIFNFDKKFDYLRVYSIQRTSINGVPIVRRVQDLDLKTYSPITGDAVTSVNSSIIPVCRLNNQVIDPYYDFDEDLGNNEEVGGEVNANWVGLYMSNYPDLLVSTSEGYVTWGEVPSGASDIVMWFGVETNGTIPIRCTTKEDRTALINFRKSEDGFDVLVYTDNGYSGDTIDPTELLYKGGNGVVAGTMEQKDGTLFLGNIDVNKIVPPLSSTKYSQGGAGKTLLKWVTDAMGKQSPAWSTTTPPIISSTRDIIVPSSNSGSYPYGNQLSSTDSEGYAVSCKGFKRGDYYRLGVQFQHNTGGWSEPVFINDVQQSESPNLSDSTLTLTSFEGRLSAMAATALKAKGYVKVRGVVCLPEAQDRVCLYQGVINPVLYSQDNYIDNKITKAQSSWFFRSKYSSAKSDDAVTPYFSINGTLVYGVRDTNLNPEDLYQAEIQGDFTNHKFKLTTNLVTFNSPDLEFDPAAQTLQYLNLGYRHVGDATIDNTFSDINIVTETPNISSGSSGFIHKSFSKSDNYGIVSGLFYEDWIVDDNNSNIEAWVNEKKPVKYLVYPWQKTGSLNNDINRPAGKGITSAVLKQKVISNLRYAATEWAENIGIRTAFDSDADMQLYNSATESIIKVGTDTLYQGNVNTVLSPQQSDGIYYKFDGNTGNDYKSSTPGVTEYWWKTYGKESSSSEVTGYGLYLWNNNSWSSGPVVDAIGNDYSALVLKKDLVRMKYKSAPHFVLKKDFSSLWPNSYNYKIPIIELCRDANTEFMKNLYGGTSDDALRENVWIPCGEPVSLSNISKTEVGGNTNFQCVIFNYSYGDTYYQRYDCLKTYAFTPDDENQIVEIGSFMLETRVNIDGRYDRNRGQVNNTMMSPLNFNLMNLVYSQRDNFFNYRIQDADYYKNKSYPNQITWSLVKESGAEIDAWTNINLGSVLELDGDKGSISKLIRFNDQLLAFQDSGISQILYNENMQIASTTGVPIEIANSQKVEGKRYLSDSVGCTNKWSIASTPSGIYFMDSNNKGIYHLSDGLKNLSLEQGFNTWSKKAIQAGKIWNPGDFESFVSYYDRQNQDVLFIDENHCLAFSEKFGVFTSFYSYEKAPYFINYKDTGLWLSKSREKDADSNYHIYQHNDGKYCEFFDKSEEYYMELIGNPEPLVDKIFTNLEFRACVDGEGDDESTPYTPYIPFDSLYAENEYQKGELKLQYKHGLGRMQHYHREEVSGVVKDSSAPLNRKFRIWRCDIPRNNKGTGRTKLDRMRNPWLKLRLTKLTDTSHRTEVHDMVMTYYV